MECDEKMRETIFQPAKYKYLAKMMKLYMTPRDIQRVRREFMNAGEVKRLRIYRATVLLINRQKALLRKRDLRPETRRRIKASMQRCIRLKKSMARMLK